MNISSAIGVLGICGAVIFGLWTTGSANCLWGLVFIALLM